jgi:hypothetical protein
MGKVEQQMVHSYIRKSMPVVALKSSREIWTVYPVEGMDVDKSRPFSSIVGDALVFYKDSVFQETNFLV